jgi:hypothetical protein
MIPDLMQILRRPVGCPEAWSCQHKGAEDETGKPHSHEGLLNALEEKYIVISL